MSDKPSEKLSEKQSQEITSLCNSTIHELVFISQLAEDDMLDDARECFTAALLNIDQLSALLGTSNAKANTHLRN